MKFGSVAFFKKLIVAAGIIIIAGPLILAIVFGVLFARQKGRADWLQTMNWALLQASELPEGMEYPDEIQQLMQSIPPDVTFGPTFDYQKQYPNLYVNRPEVTQTEGKVCYLTFDDGPSAVSMQVLNTLREYDVKATFFVTGANAEENPEVIKAAFDAGHSIGVHSYSHVYQEIYASVDAFLADFEKMHARITAITGEPPTVFRFPGGSINAYNQGNYQQIIAEMTRRGYAFYDWNAAAGDAVAGGVTRAEILESVQGSVDADRVVLLMHDRQDSASTATALPAVIEWLDSQGYRFAALTPQVEGVSFSYQN